MINVLPPLSSPNPAHALEADSSQGRQFDQRQIAFTDQPNLRFGDLGVGMSLAWSVTVPADHVSHVLSAGTGSQVCGLHTDGPVAGMQDFLPCRDLTVIDEMSNPGGYDIAATKADEAISVVVGNPRPVPASQLGWISWQVPGKCFDGAHAARPVFLHGRTINSAQSAPSSVMTLTPSSTSRGVVAVDNAAGGDDHREN